MTTTVHTQTLISLGNVLTHLMIVCEDTNDGKKVIYTTNPIESYHRMIRKVTKTKGAFNSETAIIKQIYLATINAHTRWRGTIFGWTSIRLDLNNYFGNRFLNNDTLN